MLAPPDEELELDEPPDEDPEPLGPEPPDWPFVAPAAAPFLQSLDGLALVRQSFAAIFVEDVALALGEDVVLVLGEVVVVDEEGVDEFTLDVVDESFFLKWSPMASALPQARAAMETEMNNGASLRIRESPGG